jgi:hypothetical protein
MGSGNENQIRQLIEQLYENEGLTDALTDESAKILLGWGEQQLKGLLPLAADPDKLESAAQQLQQVIRTVNRLIEQKAELSDTEMVQQLLRLVEQAMQLNTQKSIAGAAPASGTAEEGA